MLARLFRWSLRVPTLWITVGVLLCLCSAPLGNSSTPGFFVAMSGLAVLCWGMIAMADDAMR